MIFHRITLNNLFSYKGEQSFEFASQASDGSKLALVLGRNGFGKTSFLNAVKLLFLGSDNKGLRQGMTRPTYVLGDGKDWSGLLNRQAKKDGEDKCSIEAEIGPPGKAKLTIKRSWHLDGDTFSPDNEILEVKVGKRPLAGEAAQARLYEFLPRDLVPFFLFDGEEIRYLAETSDINRAEAMERLLSLSFVNGVEGILGDITREWRRETLPQEIQAQIAAEEGKLNAAHKSVDAYKAKLDDFGEQKRELEEQTENLKHQMDNLRGSGSFMHTDGLDQEIALLEKDLQDLQNSLAYSLASDAPLTANPSLVKASLSPLRQLIDKKSKATDSVLETLFEVLPERLFVEAPQPKERLNDDQQDFYTKKLKRILDSFGIQEDETAHLFEGLDLIRARTLYERLQGISASMQILRGDASRRLREISKLKTQLEDKRAERREAQYGSSETAEHYKKLEEEFAATQQQIGTLNSEIARTEEQLNDKEEEQKALKRVIKELERQADDASKADKRLKIAVGLKGAFKEYRRIRRESKREQIQKTLNRHFKKLMSGHDLIREIEVDEDFYLTFMDKNGESIGHSTISHGMRQLAVTALLWALKDVSGKQLPIIVDTPLARIDHDNQENLLQHYYPEAAEQVIVLATDSEIDERKYELVRPQIGQLFILGNADGESTTIKEIKSSSKQGPKWEDVING